MARLLYSRWESLTPAEREKLGPLARDVKERALEVRGKVDDGSAETELAVVITFRVELVVASLHFGADATDALGIGLSRADPQNQRKRRAGAFGYKRH